MNTKGETGAALLNRLIEGFADVLSVSVSDLREAFESDGCSYSDEDSKSISESLQDIRFELKDIYNKCMR